MFFATVVVARCCKLQWEARQSFTSEVGSHIFYLTLVSASRITFATELHKPHGNGNGRSWIDSHSNMKLRLLQTYRTMHTARIPINTTRLPWTTSWSWGQKNRQKLSKLSDGAIHDLLSEARMKRNWWLWSHKHPAIAFHSSVSWTFIRSKNSRAWQNLPGDRGDLKRDLVSKGWKEQPPTQPKWILQLFGDPGISKKNI